MSRIGDSLVLSAIPDSQGLLPYLSQSSLFYVFRCLGFWRGGGCPRPLYDILLDPYNLRAALWRSYLA